MATRSRPKARKTDTPEPARADSASATIDSTLEDWSTQATREQLGWEIAACRTWLRGARAVREAQLQAGERAEAAHLKAAERLLQARSLNEIAEIQLELMRADVDETLTHFMQLADLGTRSALEAFGEATEGWARASRSAWQGLNAWSHLQSLVASNGEIAEAEVEHFTNPLSASPLVWPAQEAARQAADFASSAWHDWVEWSSRLATNGGRPAH
jgi:hypothetical protein